MTQIPKPDSAALLFAASVVRGQRDLEEVCREHPEEAERLRTLFEHWSAVDEALVRIGRGGALSTRIQTLRAKGHDTAVSLGETEGDGAPPEATEGIVNRASGGRYVARGEVGSGGMGSILRVWDTDLRRNLAMKVVLGQEDLSKPSEESRIDDRSLARFIEEAQVTGQLVHPGIVPVHELGVDDDGRVYFTMQLVAGRDLEAIFRLVQKGEEGWTQTRAVNALLKVCEAVSYAHSKGVVHRDLKPANVMVGKFGEVYVMDWGLARVLGRKDSHDLRVRKPDTTFMVRTDLREALESGRADNLVTMDGDIVGTPAYMPPEQARGRLKEVGPLSDVYSMGAILYHLLAGHEPYMPPEAGRTGLDAFSMLLESPPDPLEERAPEAAAELIAICEKAMQRDPEARYPGMEDLAEDLRRYLEGRVVRAYETGAVAEFRKWVKRNKTLAVTALSATLIILLGSTTAALVLADKNKELGAANVEVRRNEELARQSAEEARENELQALANERLASERADEILRLADVTRLGQLQVEADDLWPALPDKVRAYEEWLETARELRARLELHTRTLEDLRIRALVQQAPWRFATAEDQWQHDTLASLVQKLEALGAEDGLITDVEERHAFASTVEEATVTGELARERWREAIASISDPAECPAYAGLVIEPQLGLLPIGLNPDSGLWEFAHLQTGVPAQRDRGSSNLGFGEASGIVLVLLPGGTVWMGAQGEDPAALHYSPGAGADEAPVHPVELEPFFLSKFELNQAQWLRVTGTNPSVYNSQFPGVTLLNPVERIAWAEARRTLERLDLALPTESQWEYAARAGTPTPWWTGEDRESLRGAANLADQAAARGGASWPGIEDWPDLDDGYGAHAAVDLFRPNPFGLHQMTGNVYEWCEDGFGVYGEVFARIGDGLREPEEIRYRITRGGSFRHEAYRARSSYRNATPPDTTVPELGVRPARPLRRSE